MPPITRQTPFSELPELMRLAEVAAYLGIHYDTVRAMVRSGDLKAHYLSGRMGKKRPRPRVTRDELMLFVSRTVA